MVLAIIIILILHFFGDFVFQSHWMSSNKSKKVNALLLHVCVYTIFILPVGWFWALLNGLIHFGVDFTTSKITSYLYTKSQIPVEYYIETSGNTEEYWTEYKNKCIHNFFVVIGFDQLIHTTTLLLTYFWLAGKLSW